MKSFEDTLEKFVDCAEGYALYGQVWSSLFLAGYNCTKRYSSYSPDT